MHKENNSNDGNKFPARKNIRLRNYDYSKAGMYFITICTNDKECFLGSVIDEKVNLSTIGK